MESMGTILLWVLWFVLPLSHKKVDISTDRLSHKKMDIFSTDSYVCKKLWFRDGFSKVIANTFAPKTQYSLLIARLFAPKSQYSHRDIASFGDRQRAIMQLEFAKFDCIPII